MRRLGHEMVDNTSKIAHYVPHGTIKHFNTNKRVGKFRLITWLPFIESDESYIEPEDARWEFIGYLKCKPLVKMSFREFLKMRK